MPLPLSTNVTPAGSAPVTLSAAVGVPTVVTVNVPGDCRRVKVVVFALVNAGAPLTVSVKVCDRWRPRRRWSR